MLMYIRDKLTVTGGYSWNTILMLMFVRDKLTVTGGYLWNTILMLMFIRDKLTVTGGYSWNTILGRVETLQMAKQKEWELLAPLQV